METVTRPTADAPSPWKLIGGRLCLDFVNTVGGRRPRSKDDRSAVAREKLTGWPELVSWGVAAGALPASARRAAREPAGALTRARALREAIHALLAGASPALRDL